MILTISTGNISHQRQNQSMDLIPDIKQRINLWKEQSDHEQSGATIYNAIGSSGDHIYIPPNPDEPLLKYTFNLEGTQVEEPKYELTGNNFSST